jgi:hypothetical protein
MKNIPHQDMIKQLMIKGGISPGKFNYDIVGDISPMDALRVLERITPDSLLKAEIQSKLRKSVFQEAMEQSIAVEEARLAEKYLEQSQKYKGKKEYADIVAKGEAEWKTLHDPRTRKVTSIWDKVGGALPTKAAGTAVYKYEPVDFRYAHMHPKIREITNTGPGGIGPPIKLLISEQSFLERIQSDINSAQKMKEGEEAEDLESYGVQRFIQDMEESGVRQEETLKLTEQRAKFWERVEPQNVRIDFLVEELGFSEAESVMLRSGKYNKSMLGKDFAYRMAQYEIAGSLPKSMSGMPTGRIASFGMYQRERGSIFLGMFGSGKSAFIPGEQQQGVMRQVFGRTKQYRIAGTGEIATPEQLAKMKVTRYGYGTTIGSPEEARIMLERYIEQAHEKASLERRGKIPYYIEPVDVYTYNKFKTRMSERIDEEQLTSEIYTEAISNPVLTMKESNRISIEEIGRQLEAGEITSEEAEVKAKDVQQGIQTKSFQELSKQERMPFEEPRGIIKPYYYRDQESRLRELYRKNIIRYSEKVKVGNEVIRVQKYKYEKEFEKRFPRVIRKFQREGTVSLSRRSPEDIEDILSGYQSGGEIPILYKGNRDVLIQEDIPNMGDLYLTRRGKSSIAASELQQEAPARASAEQIFDVYFKQKKGKKTFGAYTAAGTYIGETAPGVTPPSRAYAKIFENQRSYFNVAWGNEQDFLINRYMAVEQEKKVRKWDLVKQEIRSIGDIEKKHQLQYSRNIQKTLSAMYYQYPSEGGYGLIDKYRWDPNAGSYRDVSTGSSISKKEFSSYKRGIESEYAKHHEDLMRERLARSHRPPPEEGIIKRAGRSRAGKMVLGALGLSAALLTIKAVSSKKYLVTPEDVPSSNYEPTQEINPSSRGGQIQRPSARIIPTNTGTSGYTTNIDINTTNSAGINPNDLARVMDHHAKNVLGSRNGRVTVDISDNSDRSTENDLRRKYYNMVRS